MDYVKAFPLGRLAKTLDGYMFQLRQHGRPTNMAHRSGNRIIHCAPSVILKTVPRTTYTPPAPPKPTRPLPRLCVRHFQASDITSCSVAREKFDTKMPSAVTEEAKAAHAPASSWVGNGGAAAFDLRSDTMTTPTMAMLSAIQATTLLDDVFAEDPTTNDLEAHVAALAGKEAGLFVLSGTMGNQVALRSLLTQPPYSVLCDYRSHIMRYEAGGVASLSGAMLIPVTPKNGLYLTLADIQEHAVLSTDVHACPTRVISLENTINGLVTPLEEARRISEFARQQNVKMHCDGARLWEAVVASAGSLQEYGECFDTISLCFSKGLGAPIGSMLVGSNEVIRQGRWVRKSIGGGLRQSGVVTAAARVAVDVTFGKGPSGEGGLLRASHDTAKRVEKMWTDLGGKLVYPVDSNMCWLDLGSLDCKPQRFEELGHEVGLRLMGNRIITHYQVGEEAIKRLAGVFEKVASERDKAVEGNGTAITKNGTGPYDSK